MTDIIDNMVKICGGEICCLMFVEKVDLMRSRIRRISSSSPT
jgi:hypothetical protein